MTIDDQRVKAAMQEMYGNFHHTMDQQHQQQQNQLQNQSFSHFQT